MRKLKYSLLILFACAGISCNQTPAQTQFDPRNFHTSNYNLVLCLDLTADLMPAAGLVINGNPSLTAGQHYVALPFESSAGQSNPDIVSTWGSYSKFTLITFFASERMNSGNGVGITPRLRIYAPADLLGSETSREAVYMIASGEERKLIFKYPRPDQNTMGLPPQLQPLKLDSPDAIAVRLPATAKPIGSAIFLNEKPKHELEKSDLRIRYYPGTIDRAKEDTLELMYIVKPNIFQNFFVEYATKIIGLIIVPGLTLFFMRKEEVRDAAQRKKWLWILGISQVVLMIALFVFFLFVGASESNVKHALDVTLLFVGGLLVQWVALMKVSDKKTA